MTLEVDAAPLSVTLGLLLKQLDLGYLVRDGMLKIGKASTVHRVRRHPVPSHRALLLGTAGGLLRRLRWTHSAQYEDEGIRATRQVETAQRCRSMILVASSTSCLRTTSTNSSGSEIVHSFT